jgi:hypothetical protein
VERTLHHNTCNTLKLLSNSYNQKVKATTLVEALIASVIIVSILSVGFIFVQQHLKNSYHTKLKMDLLPQMEKWMEQSIEQQNFFEEEIETPLYTMKRTVELVEMDGLIKLNVQVKHTDLPKALIISRIVQPHN